MASYDDHHFAVTEYWFDHYVKDGLCTLCGNSGLIDTTETAWSPTGQRVGALNFCICPNGRMRRRADIIAVTTSKDRNSIR